MNWGYDGVNFKLPLKLWSCAGKWEHIDLLAVTDNEAWVRVERKTVNSKKVYYVYESLDLIWHETLSTPQLRNYSPKDKDKCLTKRDLVRI